MTTNPEAWAPVIALDYDKTYDLNPDMWKKIIPIFQASGFNVVLATHRDKKHDRTDLLRELETIIPVYYTGGVAKRWYMEQFAPEWHSRIAVWVDDKPEAILHNSTMTREALSAWRTEQAK